MGESSWGPRGGRREEEEASKKPPTALKFKCRAWVHLFLPYHEITARRELVETIIEKKLYFQRLEILVTISS
jgi:hypothetical protein